MAIPELLRCVTCPDILLGKSEVPKNQTSFFLFPTDAETSGKTSDMAQHDGPTLLVADIEYVAGNSVQGATKFPSMWAVASLPARVGLELAAKVPQVSKRSTCTWSTLINLYAVLADSTMQGLS